MASTADGFFLSAYTDCNDNELLRRMRTGDEESKEIPFAFRLRPGETDGRVARFRFRLSPAPQERDIIRASDRG